MEPRFIMKTHTGALRPGNYSILISKCTYPDKGSYPETVAKKLEPFLRELHQEEEDFRKKGKKSIAEYTVRLAGRKNRGFGFLLDNMIWSWKGHVINTVLSRLNKNTREDVGVFFPDELPNLERVTYLRYFLETEGALILKIAEKISEKGEISYSYLKENIQRIFQEIYESYIDASPDFRTRVRVREMLKEMQKQMKSREKAYDKSTLSHKIKPHIQALKDLEILDIEERKDDEIYKSVALSTLFKGLVDIQRMEIAFSNYGYFELIAKVLKLEPAEYDPDKHRELVEEAIFYGYSVMKDKVTGMADIDALIDWCCIKMLSEDNILIGKQDVERFFDEMRRQKPATIHYEVDRKGRIAYVILLKVL